MFLISYLFWSTVAFAQREGNIWYFGNKAGLDFNNGSPVILTNSSLRAFEGSASIADANGNLLFYTDGVTVRNRLHQVMVNGTGLMGDSSSTQSGIIVPQPGNSLYYIFTVDNTGGPDGLRYSVVDMTQEKSLGAITSKNNLLTTPVTEKITAVKHRNNIDTWVIAHGWNSNTFYAYLITRSGISNANRPVVSKVGTTHTGSFTNTIGYLKSSPDGKKLALGIRQMNTYELFDFDHTTGIVSNATTFKSTNYNSPYGVEFSPDGSKLYVNSTLNPTAKIYQIDLADNNAVTLIGASKSPYAGAMQLGPDGKIYVARYENSIVGGSKYLGVIHHPDASGMACTYTDNGLYLGGATSLFGLPNFIQTYFYKPLFTYANTCFNSLTSFHITDRESIQKVQWLFDDPVTGIRNLSTEINPSHTFSLPGAHEVSVTVWYKDGTFRKAFQTIEIKSPLTVDLGRDTLLCSNQQLMLRAHVAGATYRWQDESTGESFTVKKPGVYWVEATLNGCTARDSIYVSYAHSFLIDLGNDTTLCKGSALKLLLPDNGTTYRWQDGSKGNTLTVTAEGIYWVEASTPCEKTVDSIKVNFISSPVLNFTEEVIYYKANELLSLNASQDAPDVTYSWQDGSTNASFTVNAPGIYWVKAMNKCGTVIDTVVVKELVEAYRPDYPDNPRCESSTIPNVITPNGDGVNDTFVIPCTQRQEWKIIIYNRWGKIVYQNDFYRGDWQADDLTNGAYYYLLKSKDSKTQAKGVIHVLR